MADREGKVAVGIGPPDFGDEPVPRNLAHRLEDPLAADVAGCELPIHHAAAFGVPIGRRALRARAIAGAANDGENEEAEGGVAAGGHPTRAGRPDGPGRVDQRAPSTFAAFA